MSRHTPGPWAVSVVQGCVYVDADNGDREIASCGATSAATGQKEADARLIAAAPELLEACQRFAALVPLLRMLTVRQVLDAGNDAIDAAGLNPYCINEGLAEGHEPAISSWKLDAIDAAIEKATQL